MAKKNKKKNFSCQLFFVSFSFLSILKKYIKNRCYIKKITIVDIYKKIEDYKLLNTIPYFLKNLNFFYYNNEFCDKKLFAIMRYLKYKKPELEKTRRLVKVITDHKSFEYYMIIKKITQCQAH